MLPSMGLLFDLFDLGTGYPLVIATVPVGEPHIVKGLSGGLAFLLSKYNGINFFIIIIKISEIS